MHGPPYSASVTCSSQVTSSPSHEDPGLTLTALSAEPGTPSHDGLRLLASWAATLEQGA